MLKIKYDIDSSAKSEIEKNRKKWLNRNIQTREISS